MATRIVLPGRRGQLARDIYFGQHTSAHSVLHKKPASIRDEIGGPPDAGEPQKDLKVGQSVEVLWEGKWWPANVLKREDDKAFVKYDGYGDEWNEWVGPDRLRTGTGPGAASPQRLPIEQQPPVVVKTVPEAGDKEVNPASTEIRVTYSKRMMDKSWSWSTDTGLGEFPEIAGDIRYLEDGRTCVMPVKLKPGTTYAIRLNSSKFHNFKDAENRPAVPYLLTFKTKEE